MSETPAFAPIGVMRSPFAEKFGAPRQAGLVPMAEALLELDPRIAPASTVAGLESFSHVWLIWSPHLVPHARTKTTVRPPRLGGNVRVGALASRSVFRPNPIGLSLVRLLGVEHARESGAVRLRLGGVDVVDGTPVLDVKPYLPWADAAPEARAGWAPEPPQPVLEIAIAPAAEPGLLAAERRRPGFAALASAVLALDPRPGFAGSRPPRARHGFQLAGHEIAFAVEGRLLTILAVHPTATAAPEPDAADAAEA